MTQKRTYTLAQAQAELLRRQCGARGHQPLIFSYDMTAKPGDKSEAEIADIYDYRQGPGRAH
jgi:hypothetical protein